jgi:hypothetical protein
LSELIQRFGSVNLLKSELEIKIENAERIITEYSNLLGEKIRINEELSKDDPDFLDLKNRLDGRSDAKKNIEKNGDNTKNTNNKNVQKKKKPSKKSNEHWYDLGHIMIYNGIGLKGELELYFKAIDELKVELDLLRRTLSALNDIIEKGLKQDMACITLKTSDDILRISFLKPTDLRKEFSLKLRCCGTPIPIDGMVKAGIVSVNVE